MELKQLNKIFKGGVTIVNPEKQSAAMQRFFGHMIRLYEAGEIEVKSKVDSKQLQEN